MEIGMLWFDNDPKTDLLAKVERAAKYYQEKYGTAPNLCYISPTTPLPEPADTPPAITLRHHRSVLANHFWLGVAKDTKGKS